MADKCPGCGHNFYTTTPVRDGLCKWCVKEKENPEYCHVCKSEATCTGRLGYLCDSESCAGTDQALWEERLGDDE
jgi:hypothetical protein